MFDPLQAEENNLSVEPMLSSVCAIACWNGNLL